jgi:hypothetical protein
MRKESIKLHTTESRKFGNRKKNKHPRSKARDDRLLTVSDAVLYYRILSNYTQYGMSPSSHLLHKTIPFVLWYQRFKAALSVAKFEADCLLVLANILEYSVLGTTMRCRSSSGA